MTNRQRRSKARRRVAAKVQRRPVRRCVGCGAALPRQGPHGPELAELVEAVEREFAAARRVAPGISGPVWIDAGDSSEQDDYADGPWQAHDAEGRWVGPPRLTFEEAVADFTRAGLDGGAGGASAHPDPA